MKAGAGRHRLALATCAALPHLTDDDRELVAALAARGWAPVPTIWNDPQADWRVGGVLIRSCWDYHVHPGEFTAWLDQLDGAGVSVANPVPVIRWNLDKRYLQQLADDGIPIVPTHFVPSGATPPALEGVLAEAGWAEAVLKPAISGGAHRTWRVSAEQAAAFQGELADLAGSTGALIQAFVPQIESGGEWSLVLFGGTWSHAVLKRSAPNDFRVQDIHGGTVTAADPPAELRALAHRISAFWNPPLPYLRVDVVETDLGWQVMEVEAIEPNLFLATAPGSANQLAEAVTAALRTPCSPLTSAP